jgi:phosphoenolpyruvate-protein kinase (PTS system EI component)
MPENKEETASFVLRLTQKIYKSDEGEPQVQWRGNIRHVQSGDEQRIADYEAATEFVRKKLGDLTQKAVENQPEEEQKGILSKSIDFWKKVATEAPKLVIETIKDPKKQATHLQEQITEQFQQIGDNLEHKIEERFGKKIELEDILGSSKADFRKILEMLTDMSEQINTLNKRVEKLSKPKK